MKAHLRAMLDPELTSAIEGIVEGWYMDQPFDPWDDFFDRLEGYLPTREFSSDWDDPTIRAIQKYARKIKRESQ